MNLSLDIARRYLLGKKSTNAINIITWVSILGLSIGTAALILILSVFNGFETVLTGLFDSFNPQLKVEPISGKYFSIDSSQLYQLKQIPEVEQIAKTIEEVALFEYGGTKRVGKIKGVDEFFSQVTTIDSSLRSGQLVLDSHKIKYGIVGSGMASKLSIDYNDALTPIIVYMPTIKNRGPLAKDYKSLDLYASGIFSAGGEADEEFIVTHYDDVNRLLDMKDMLSFIEIKLKDGADELSARKAILEIIGDNYIIKNKFEQDATFFKIMNTEKWVSFMITCFILFIIAFNLVGSLWMIVLEKKQDLSILQAMGFTSVQVRNLILYQGGLISLIGLVSGTILALLLYFIHINVGLVGIPESFMIDSYPVDLYWGDFVLVAIVVMAIGLLASLLPAMRAEKITPFVRMEG